MIASYTANVGSGRQRRAWPGRGRPGVRYSWRSCRRAVDQGTRRGRSRRSRSRRRPVEGHKPGDPQRGPGDHPSSTARGCRGRCGRCAPWSPASERTARGAIIGDRIAASGIDSIRTFTTRRPPRGHLGWLPSGLGRGEASRTDRGIEVAVSTTGAGIWAARRRQEPHDASFGGAGLLGVGTLPSTTPTRRWIARRCLRLARPAGRHQGPRSWVRGGPEGCRGRGGPGGRPGASTGATEVGAGRRWGLAREFRPRRCPV
jgi:hypothetical protein